MAVDAPFLRKAIEDGASVVLQLVVDVEGLGHFGVCLQRTADSQLAPRAGEKLLS